MKETVISIKNFSKSFGKKKVINDLSFEVKKGDIFAFLGPNGSGKTTTIRALLNIYKPDSGELLIENQKYSTKLASIIGYLPEERGLYLNSRVLETLVYFGELKGLAKDLAIKRARSYLKQVDLQDKEKTEIKKLSSGQQQKIQLGITVINKPKILILDEPTKGLDPVNRELLLNILFDYSRDGATIIFSTHQMEEVEKIANRMLMIKDGESALYGSVEEVKDSFGKNTIKVEFNGEFPKNSFLFSANVNTNYAELTPEKNIGSEEILKFLVGRNLNIKKFEIASPSLNEIFIKVMSTKK